MTKHVITIGDATVDSEVFAAYNKQAQKELKEHDEAADKAKELLKDFKDTVESAATTTKLPKAEISAYFKARYEESKPKDEKKVVGTKVVIDRGELYTTLNSVLEA